MDRSDVLGCRGVAPADAFLSGQILAAAAAVVWHWVSTSTKGKTMKNRPVMLMFSVFAMVSLNLSYADDESGMALCKAAARESYLACEGTREDCRAESRQNIRNCFDLCGSRKSYESDRTYGGSGATYNASGRFEPAQIPQRPVYVLPGMQ